LDVVLGVVSDVELDVALGVVLDAALGAASEPDSHKLQSHTVSDNLYALVVP
jgi:hypothetical protein